MSDPSSGRPPPRSPDVNGERTDPFGWLYRDERSGGQAAAGGPPPVRGGTPTEPYVVGGVAYTPPPGSPAGSWPVGPGESGPQDPVFGLGAGSGPAGPRGPRRPSRGPVVGVILIAVLLVVALIGGALFVLRPGSLQSATAPPSSETSVSATSPEASTPAPGTSGEPTGGPYAGEVAPITATGAKADCVAPDGVDAAGTDVPYTPANVIDEEPSTAWRCNGDGIGEQITIALPDSTVAQLGFVNGYAKIDPADGSDRYPEYRRILEVEWRLSNGATFTQTAQDGTEGLQTLAIPVQHDITSITLVIKRVTAPGLQDKTRDAVLISTIQVSAPA